MGVSYRCQGIHGENEISKNERNPDFCESVTAVSEILDTGRKFCALLDVKPRVTGFGLG